MMTARVTTKGGIVPLAVHSWAETRMLIRKQMKDKYQFEGKLGSGQIIHIGRFRKAYGTQELPRLTTAMTEPSFTKHNCLEPDVPTELSAVSDPELSCPKNKSSFCIILISLSVINI
jgi:hypothetical protein